METTLFEQLWSNLSNYISVPYLFIFMLLSYTIKRYCKTILETWLKKMIAPVFIVLIIAFIVAIPYYFFTSTGWEKILFTYAFGTSLHELIFTWVEDKFVKK